MLAARLVEVAGDDALGTLQVIKVPHPIRAPVTQSHNRDAAQASLRYLRLFHRRPAIRNAPD
jgi:hypothetical protein